MAVTRLVSQFNLCPELNLCQFQSCGLIGADHISKQGPRRFKRSGAHSPIPARGLGLFAKQFGISCSVFFYLPQCATDGACE